MSILASTLHQVYALTMCMTNREYITHKSQYEPYNQWIHRYMRHKAYGHVVSIDF